MELKCEAVCTKVYKKSSSPAFKNLQVGDIIISLQKSSTLEVVLYI